jgi:four helix bundle protein
MDQFDHEKLDVYNTAVEFVALADVIIKDFPEGGAHLADQLRRASTSIPFNIAEGAGEYSRNDTTRFYRMARRSTTECASIPDACRCLQLADPGKLSDGRRLLLRIVAMLIGMARVYN